MDSSFRKKTSRVFIFLFSLIAFENWTQEFKKQNMGAGVMAYLGKRLCTCEDRGLIPGLL